MKDNKKSVVIGLFVVAVATVATNSINSVFSLYIAKFPEYTIPQVYQMATLPSLFQLGLNLIAGFFIGRKLSFKTTFIIGSMLYHIDKCFTHLFKKSYCQ